MIDHFAHLETPRFVADDPAAFDTAASTMRFVCAGRAVFTLESLKTGTRFTYRVAFPKNRETGEIDRNAPLMVSVLTGPDNTSDYRYLGYIKRGLYYHGHLKAKIAADAPSAIAFGWFFKNLTQDKLHPSLKVYHEGKCGRCGRALTVPESIKSGFGPECIGKL